MEERSLCVAEISLVATIVFILPLEISGWLEPPSGVTIRAVHEADFLIISWNFQAGVRYYRILIINHKSSNAPDEAGPMKMYCSSDNTTCSYCISNINRAVSCSTFDSQYTGSIGIRLDFEQPISVKVEACANIFPEDCLDRSEWKNYTISPGEPSAVWNVHARPLSSKTMEVTWFAPNQTRGTILLYSVLYRTERGREMIQVFRNVTKGILTRLKPKTKYTIWMTASTVDKEGKRSDLTTAETYVDECVSDPCKYNGQCHVDGGSFTCECTRDWAGRICSDPKGFALKKNRCLDVENDKNSSLHSNVSIEFCAAQCRSVSSCRSFEYGLGYSGSGRFVHALHQNELGYCELLSTGTTNHKLMLCYYDYYEKKPPVSVGSDLLSSNVVFFRTIVLLNFVQTMLLR